jgi:hypothetical protein
MPNADTSQQAASYPANNTEELQAVITFLSLLDVARVKPQPNWLDKIPNTDGSVELVGEDQRSLGRLEIQVKKLPDGATSFQCPVALIDYSERSLLPLLLVCADVANKRAYFRHLHRAMMPELPPGQASFVIHFDPKVHSISTETQYVRQWTEILEERRQRISEHPRLAQIAARIDLNHVPHKDRVYFQEYIENINRLLELDFPAVKDQFFTEAWKLGVAVAAADATRVFFQLYTILPGDPDIRVSGISAPKALQHTWIGRGSLKEPLPQAEDFVLDKVAEMLKGKSFPLLGPRLAIEYLFWFVDEFGVALGIERSDRLSVADLQYGVSVFLPAWCSLAVPRYLGELLRLNRGNEKQLAYAFIAPPFESIASLYPPAWLPARDQVLDATRSGKVLNPVRLAFHQSSPRMLANAVEFLAASKQEFITRPYKPKAGHGPWIWSGYTVEALRHNISTVLEGCNEEYRLFVQRNRLPLKDSRYIHQPVARIFRANLELWASSHTDPVIETFVVKNDDQKLPTVTFVDASQDPTQLVTKDQTLTLRGTKRQLIGSGWRVADAFFGKLPLLTRIYAMLRDDLEAQFSGFRFPQ